MNKRIVKRLEWLRSVTEEQIREAQLFDLQKLVKFHYRNNKRYRLLMNEQGISPRDVQSLDDLIHLPIITAEHITQPPIEEFHSIPQQDIATFLETSGSTGRPKIFPIGRKERRAIFEQVALMFYIGGVGRINSKNGRSDQRIYSLFPFGPWPSQFFSQHASEELGPTVRADIRMPMEWHKDRLEFFKPTYIITFPSFISFLYEQLRDEIDFPSFGIDRILLAGEPFSESFRSKIEKLYRTKVIDVYGCAEISAASVECDNLRCSGLMHLYDPTLIIEVVDPKTKKPLPDEETGEIIVTNLARHSMPIIRYEMGDLLFKSNEKCSCGFNLPLVSRIQGRADDVFQYGAANIYPSTIYEAIDYAGIGDKFQLKIEPTDEELSEKIVLYVEDKDPTLDDDFSTKVNEYIRDHSTEFREIVYNIKFRPPIKVEIVPPGTLFHQGNPKLKRIVDMRKE